MQRGPGPLVSLCAPCVQAHLEQIQSVLNATEVGLHQLTALVDCRSLHMVRFTRLRSHLSTALAGSRGRSLATGLRPGADRAVLRRGGGPNLPGALLLRHRPDVLLHRLQCAPYLARQEVTHTQTGASVHTIKCSLQLCVPPNR